MKCDVCDTEIPDTQIYDISIGIPLTQATLCKKCVDEYKDMLSNFIKRKHPYYLNREKIGTPYKYNIISRVSKDIPHEPFYINQRARPEPKHEGRRPTNIFSKLFYMLFFEKVDP